MKDPMHPRPIGVMSRRLWLELRAKNLARAIQEYVQDEHYHVPAKYDWLGQLAKVLEELAE